MDLIREIVDSEAFESIISLPRHLKNRKVEVRVNPVEEQPVRSQSEKEKALEDLYGLWADRDEIHPHDLRKSAWATKP